MPRPVQDHRVGIQRPVRAKLFRASRHVRHLCAERLALWIKILSLLHQAGGSEENTKVIETSHKVRGTTASTELIVSHNVQFFTKT